MGWIINILALLLFPLISVVDLFTRLFSKRSENSAYSQGFKINVFANELFGSTSNKLLCKKGKEVFGVFGEPFSSAFGRGNKNKSLNKAGRIIRKIIDVFDIPMIIKGKNHTTQWIRTDKEINEYRKTLK